MKKVIVKMTEETFEKMANSIFQNYPHDEWGMFLKTNWSSAGEVLVLTCTEDISYTGEDISFGKGVVRFHEPYIVKTVGVMGRENVGVAVVHSHPECVPPYPSLTDDDMDGYLQSYFKDFYESPPYLSLIFRKLEDGEIEFTGRGVFNDKKFQVDELKIVGRKIKKIYSKDKKPKAPPEIIQKRLKRLIDCYGPQSAFSLWNSELTVVGSGGTGSPSVHSMARSGVGTINLIDFDFLNLHNSERVHGCLWKHFEGDEPTLKVEAVKELILAINPLIKVNIHKGSVLDQEAKEMILRSDLTLNCTDTEHAKVALSELVWRFFCVVLQVNVLVEGEKGRVNAQVIHLTYLYPQGPCLYCLDMVNSQRLSYELMSEEEKKARKEAAMKAEKEGLQGNAYWLGDPVIPTVGSLATIGGELVTNNAVGLITGAFEPVSIFQEIDLRSEHPSIHQNLLKKKTCVCSKAFGKCDQVGAKGVIIK